MADIVDEAQAKEQELLTKALSASTKLTSTPRGSTPGICFICQQPINQSRRDFFKEQQITAFLCGQTPCEVAYLKLKPTEVTYLPDVEEETTDD